MDRALPLPLQQTPLYLDALRRIGADAARCTLAGGRPLVLRRVFPVIGKVALLSRPEMGTDPDPARWRKTLGADLLIVNAASPKDGGVLSRAGFVRLSGPRRVAMLSLAGGQAEWLRRMDGKWRNRLRHGQRQGLTIATHALPPDPAHWLLRAEAAQQRVRGYRNLPPALIAAMAATPGALHLVTARLERAPVAAMLFARHGTGASYLIGWSDAQGRRLSAHNLILWHAMGDLAAMGVEAIDLGLHGPECSVGLAHFKRGAGAEPVVLGGTWLSAGWLTPLHALLGRLRASQQPP